MAKVTRRSTSLDYIRRSFISQIVIKHPDRAEATRVHNFPYDAIEEALVNAVYHRGYDEREPIEVRISPEDLVVVSYPGPDRSVKLTDFKRGRAVARRYRNRRIGEFLKELDLTEGRSTGIPKIFRAMKANGSSPPQFEFDEDHSYFITRLRVHPAVAKAAQKAAAKQVTGEVTPPVEKLLLLLSAEGAMSSAQIRKSLGLRDRRHLRKAYIDPAIEDGLIEYTIPDKPQSRLQKYRLTRNGRHALGG